ncbi:peptidoglycan peptidase [Salipiger bermudensis]|uniref:peptidoglycan peptidase n=1 Tax=Salipiger bermudensis TaxID=344736 RepID=UPI001CD7845E|nr:peptidoglycan peptidase [Salipiger bermudensis]MCA0964949.1 peptidoglycan peptidase [Salipiger bermudensis]
MKNYLCFLASALLAFMSSSALADDLNTINEMAETAWDWHPDDLIFRNGLSDFDELIMKSEGSEWASVGIMRASSGSPRVVYVDPVEGVTETMIGDFIEGLSESEYAVYRIDFIDEYSPDDVMAQGSLSSYTPMSAYMKPYDTFMLFGNEGFYNAELAYEAALSAGIVLGTPIPVENFASNALREVLVDRWRDYPYCVLAVDPSNCWPELKRISVGRCCRTLAMKDSHYESMQLDGRHEQARARPLPHHQLV